jgi:hypothetical protein
MSFLLLLLTAPLVAQPTVGTVQLYGLRKVSPEKIQKVLAVKPGDNLPKSKGEMELRLGALDGVAQARLEAFCCDEGKAVLYVGIQERGAEVAPWKPEPEQEITLPQDILDAYAEFAEALRIATREGDAQDDLSQGYSLLKNVPCRIIQQRFVGLAQLNIDALRNVLKNAADPEQRAIAAYVIGYAPQRAAAAGELQSALQDADPGVRLNAARALKAIAYYARQNPDDGLRVQPTWFVELLNSIELSDRLESVNDLLFFSERPDSLLTANIRERALPSLIEMAHWQYLPHALPAYLLLGRIAGYSDKELEGAWARGEREKMLLNVQKSLKK